MSAAIERATLRDTSFLEGGGELGALMRAHDWTNSPLGPPDRWPQSLRSAVSILLPSKAQIVLFWGPELVTLYNDAYRPVFGGKHPRALGMPARLAWSEIWDTGLGDLFRGVLQTGEAFWARDRLFILERNGYPEETYFDVSYDPVRDESGDVGGLFCIVSETTGRVVGERRLKTLRDLAERNANARSADEACRQSMAALAENEHDIPFALLYLANGTDSAPRFVCGSRGTTGLQEPNEWEWREALLEGSTRVASIDGHTEIPSGAWPAPPRQAAVVPIPSTAEGAAGFIVVGLSPYREFDEDYRGFLDLLVRHIAGGITHAEAYQAERKRAEALAEIDQAKTVFFSNVSHEFRTPLTLMLGPLEDTLADADALSPEQRERLSLAHRNSLRLLKLVNTLLDFSRIEAGRIDSSYEPVNLALLTSELASVFRSAIERAGLALIVDCADLGEPVYVDRQMWEKVVFNLLSNAFKFTFDGQIEVSLRRDGNTAVLTIRDSGTGIPPDELPHLFERFHRVKGAQGRTFEGSGIGLALVQELVKLHGGSVSVRSEVGHGSSFHVTMPLGSAHLPSERIGAARQLAPTDVRASAYVDELLSWLYNADGDAVHRAGAGEPPQTRVRPRIVLADDNADMRDYVQRLLGEQYEVEAVRDGIEALRAVRARRPDLVLTDIMMPEMDGVALLRELRADEELKTVPVILLSARAGEEARLAGITLGADDYLVKPFSAKELFARVASRLQLSQVQEDARAAIAKSEARYRSIFQTAGVAMWEEDFSAVKALLDGLTAAGVRSMRQHLEEHPDFVRQAIAAVRVIDVNDAALQMFGAHHKSQLLQSLDSIFLPESETAFAEELVAIYDGRQSFEAETVARTLAGNPINVLFTVAIQPTDGELRSVLVSSIDITERKRAEQALREDARVLETQNRVARLIASEMNVERIMQAITDAATELAGARFGAFFRNVVNEAGESYLLYTLTGAPRDAFEKFGSPRNTAIFAATFAGEGPVRLDDVTADPRYGKNAPHYGMPKGHLPVRSYLAVAVRSRSGEVIGGLFLGHPDKGVFTERAERLVMGVATQAGVAIDNARLYDQSLQLIGKLQDSDRHKDEFLATLSHELRNPLAPLRNSLHLLRLAATDGTSAAPLHEMMERQVNHLVRLVDDLLEMSRISRGTFELRRERVEVSAIVRNAIETSDPLLRAAGHSLTVSLPEQPLWVDGDPVRLSQVLANLLNNAAKYTDAGGEISLTARDVANAAEIAVRDNGSGISADALPHVFEMFSRGDRSSGRDQAGLGIGLALARRLVEMHGGSIFASSAGIGEGSEFVVRLPLSTSRGSQSASAPRVGATISRKGILVVDDNTDSAESLRMLLEFLGADVRVAYDGESALAAFTTSLPALVLLDIGMPGLDGYEVARRMRLADPRRKATIVALTGWGQEDDRRKAREAGFDRHLIKPADVGALQALIASLDTR